MLEVLAAVAVCIALALLLVHSNSSHANQEQRPTFDDDESRPIWNSYVGLSREELIGKLGAPERQGP